MSRMTTGIEHLASYFEMCLRDASAGVLGKAAGEHWRALRRGVVPRAEGLSQGPSATPIEFECFGAPPSRFTLDSVVRDASYDWQLGATSHHACPMLTAWRQVVWTAACMEVRARFGEDHRLHVALPQQSDVEISYSMTELYTHLFQDVEQTQNLEQWRNETNALHSALHDKVVNSSDCPVCAGGGRLRLDSRKRHADWEFKAVCLLWDAIVSTIQKHGTGWLAWRAREAFKSMPDLPPKLLMESIPIDQVQESPGGVFKWGKYKTEANTESLEAGWASLNQQWQTDRQIRINVLREAAEKRDMRRPQNEPGDKLVLEYGTQGKSYIGRVWRSEGQWTFQEDDTGIKVTAEVDTKLSLRQADQQGRARLGRAMRTEYVKQKQAASKTARKKALEADGPKTTADMSVKGRALSGKLLYTWGSLERGRVEVEVTPRADRTQEPDKEDVSKFRGAAARETTPERALRKMKAKLGKLHAKAARGEHERIVARTAQPNSTLSQHSGHTAESLESMEEARYTPALRTLNDPKSLQHVINSFEFLSSLRLHYCTNCDEEWPVFDAEWPQTGVPWAGSKAGKCETIEKAGFRASATNESRCHRCDWPSVYSKMYCEENLQHLGPRHPALSALTWYESLLIARVHPVMSVITLTATGLLCYAGHVCNYYVQVMKWIRELPAVLRDKKWFLIKRRRSIRAGAAETRQKKPTTANRHRLVAAIDEALRYMPRVYGESIVEPGELHKFPLEGEQEMFEQEELVDLAGEVHISQDVFAAWFASGGALPMQRPCAAIIHRYALDQQGLDFRGSVAGDTAWELCCRLLSLQPDQTKLGTRDIAQLLVYWLSESQVPSQMRDAVYGGMEADLDSRGKRVETEDDEQLMKCRWVRQLIHGELDAVRETCAAAGEDLPVDFEVDGEILEGQQKPANAEAREQATALLRDLQAQGHGAQSSLADSVAGAFADAPLNEDADVDGEEPNSHLIIGYFVDAQIGYSHSHDRWDSVRHISSQIASRLCPRIVSIGKNVWSFDVLTHHDETGRARRVLQ